MHRRSSANDLDPAVGKPPGIEPPGGDALLFVYNAEGGVFNALADAAHKIFSPSTYACRLCAITHHALGMRREWKHFLDTLNIPFEFLHADELRARHDGAVGVSLPAIFKLAGGRVEVLIRSDEIDCCRSVEDLKELVTARTGA